MSESTNFAAARAFAEYGLNEQRKGKRESASGPGSALAAIAQTLVLLDEITQELRMIAGAALQQRVTSAVTKLGEDLLSSQVDLQGTQSKHGFVSLTASCELDQPAVQQLLYDLEAGMPFLFVDRLVVQAPQATMGQDVGGRMRVLLAVSGQWQGAK
jgi:general secretion pathway protein M